MIILPLLLILVVIPGWPVLKTSRGSKEGIIWRRRQANGRLGLILFQRHSPSLAWLLVLVRLQHFHLRLKSRTQAPYNVTTQVKCRIPVIWDSAKVAQAARPFFRKPPNLWGRIKPHFSIGRCVISRLIWSDLIKQCSPFGLGSDKLSGSSWPPTQHLPHQGPTTKDVV